MIFNYSAKKKNSDIELGRERETIECVFCIMYMYYVRLDGYVGPCCRRK